MTTLTLAALAVWHGERAQAARNESASYREALEPGKPYCIRHNLYDKIDDADNAAAFHTQAMELLRQHINPDEA